MLHTGWISFLALSCFMWFIICDGYLNAICSLIYSFIFFLTQLHCLPISYELSPWVSTQGFCQESYIIVTSGSIIFKVKALITALYSIFPIYIPFLTHWKCLCYFYAWNFVCVFIFQSYLSIDICSTGGESKHRLVLPF